MPNTLKLLALIAALTTRIIRSVSGLALCCIGLAGLYYFLNSPFLALMEILIYVGAVCVTIVFGVMLSETDEVLPERYKHKPYPIFGLLISALLAWREREIRYRPDGSGVSSKVCVNRDWLATWVAANVDGSKVVICADPTIAATASGGPWPWPVSRWTLSFSISSVASYSG